MNVLAPFNGCSGAYLSLKRSGLKITNYFSSEIDKYCNEISQKNFPNIIQLGDINGWESWNLPKIDLLIGGSPCQGFSFAGKQLNFNDERSKLFFKYVEIFKHYKPTYFLLENVKMKKEYQDVISELLGVEPIEINSSLVSAQSRRRNYWTNIPGVTQPADKGIMLKDIVHENTVVDRGKSLCLLAGYDSKFQRERYFEKSIHQGVFNINPSGRGMNGKVYPIDTNKSDTLTTNKGEGQKISVALEEYKVPFDKTLQILDKEVARGKIGYFRKDSQANRVYYIHDKAVTLCGDAGGGAAKMGQYLFGCITPDRVEKRQNGQRFSDGKKFYTLTAQDQHGVLVEGYIRKLTPVEAERLQTYPDNFSKGVSNSQRYKMLGNSFTVDVIAHILSFIRKEDISKVKVDEKINLGGKEMLEESIKETIGLIKELNLGLKGLIEEVKVYNVVMTSERELSNAELTRAEEKKESKKTKTKKIFEEEVVPTEPLISDDFDLEPDAPIVDDVDDFLAEAEETKVEPKAVKKNPPVTVEMLREMAQQIVKKDGNQVRAKQVLQVVKVTNLKDIPQDKLDVVYDEFIKILK